MAGQQAALEGERGVPGALVPAGVVDLHGSPGGQLARQQQVVLGERQRIAGALEIQGTQHLTPRDQRHRQIGVHPGPAQQLRRLRGTGDARQILVLDLRQHHGTCRTYALRDEPVWRVPGHLPRRVGRLQRLGRVVPLDRQRADHGRLGGAEAGAPPLHHRVQQVDGRDVGEFRHGHLGELAGRAVQVQRGADPAGGVRDQGQTPARGLGLDARPVLLGDVDDRDGHAQHGLERVLQPVQRDRPGVVLVRVGRGAADRGLVDDRRAGVQDPACRGLQGLDVHLRHHFVDRAAQVLLGRHAVDLLQGRVDRDVPQLGVQHGQPDRGLRDHPRRQRHLPLQPVHGRLVGAQPQRVDIPLIVQQPHVAELHEPCAAVLAADGEGPRPALPGAHDVREQFDHEVDMLFVDHDPGGVLPERLPRLVPEQLLRLRAPQHDAALGVEDHRGHAQDIEQPARSRRPARGLVALGHGRPGCTHPMPRLRRSSRHAVMVPTPHVLPRGAVSSRPLTSPSTIPQHGAYRPAKPVSTAGALPVVLVGRWCFAGVGADTAAWPEEERHDGP